MSRQKLHKDECHHDVLQRILFIYAKLNPGIRYVQGMNEILAPIYFIFARDHDPQYKGHAESDAFYCFTNLMAEIRDRFIKSLDLSSSGIIAVVKGLNDLLQVIDLPLWQHLERNGVDPRFYSFRWLTLMLSQEFELPDVLRLWDSLFADTERFAFLNYCCCAMLVLVRKQILEGDFAENLRLLQRYPPTELLTILQTATRLREKFKPRRRGLLKSSFFQEQAPAVPPGSASSAGDEALPAEPASRNRTMRRPPPATPPVFKSDSGRERRLSQERKGAGFEEPPRQLMVMSPDAQEVARALAAADAASGSASATPVSAKASPSSAQNHPPVVTGPGHGPQRSTAAPRAPAQQAATPQRGPGPAPRSAGSTPTASTGTLTSSVSSMFSSLKKSLTNLTS